MRLIFSILIIIGTGIITMGCEAKESQMPDDFGLRFDWNTGALPPKYHYAYVITIGPGAQGKFEYSSGYDSSGKSNRWIAPFTLSKDTLEELYRYLKNQDILRTSWKTGRGLIGGSTTSLIITANGKEYQIPSISELEDADKTLVEEAMDMIRKYVPKSIWEEMNDRQTRYEESYED
jgi:hypothetical protein